MNPYLDAFEQLQELNSYKQQMWLGKRQKLVERYSWAIPNDEVINRLAEHDRIIEMGAGNGYWTHLLREVGVDIEAYDIDVPSKTWTQVNECEGETSTECVNLSRANLLLLVWPPYNEPMAKEMLSAFEGEYVAYIGEMGGCTGDAEFHEQLDEQWSLVECVEIPSYEGIRDNCYIYERFKC